MVYNYMMNNNKKHKTTIIFDMGMVLVDYRWRAFLKDLGYSEEETEEIAKAVFQNPLWQEFDRGVMGDENVIAQMRLESPQHNDAIDRIVENGKEICRTYDYSETLVKALHEKGYKIYILSNYGETLLKLGRESFKFLDYVDGEVISAHVKQMKPDREIFETILNKFQIAPENAVFFDDNHPNCEAARKMGISAVEVRGLDSILEGLEKYFGEDLRELCAPFKGNRN